MVGFQSMSNLSKDLSFDQRACFIAGPEITGTTLMCSLLDGHPNLAVFPEETNYMRTVLPRMGHLPLQERLDYLIRISNARYLFSSTPCLAYHLDKNAVLENYKEFPHEEYRSAFEVAAGLPENVDRHLLVLMIETLLGVQSRSMEKIIRWVEKTPDNSYCMGRIRKCFPEAKVIVMLRDPRGKFAGHLERKRKGDQNFSAFNPIRNWLQTAALIREHECNSASVHVVKFESLLKDPEPVMRGICDFLEIPFDPIVLNPTKSGELWRGNSAVMDKFTAISRAPVERWKQIMTPREIEWVELHCRRDMKRHGYELQSKGALTLEWFSRFPEERWSAFFKARWLSLRELLTGRFSRVAENHPK
jgi:hypothetical protein